MTARKTTTRRPAARKATPRKTVAKAVTPLPIKEGKAYFDFGCKRVWIEDDRDWNGGGALNTVPHVKAGDDDFDESHSERFDRFMLAMYELAKKAGVPIPPLPPERPGKT